MNTILVKSEHSNETYPVWIVLMRFHGRPLCRLVPSSLQVHVGHILLPEHDNLDLVAGLFDHAHRVVHVARRLAVDGDDLVIFADAAPRCLASRDNPRHEDASVFLLVLVEAAVDKGEAKAAGASVDHDGHGTKLDDHLKKEEYCQRYILVD
jgi:hypothetical protein